MKPEAVRFGNLGFDRHLVAALIAPDLDGGGGFLRDGAFLDDDFDVGLVPGADFDAAVEGVQIEIRRAGDREMFGLALDVLSAVGADKIDTACRCQQSGESECSCHFHKPPCCGLWTQEHFRLATPPHRTRPSSRAGVVAHRTAASTSDKPTRPTSM